MDVREPCHQARAVKRLELVELGCIDDASNDLAHVILFLQVDRYDAVKLGGVKNGLTRLRKSYVGTLLYVQICDDTSCDSQGMEVVLRVEVNNAGLACMHVGADQF